MKKVQKEKEAKFTAQLSFDEVWDESETIDKPKEIVEDYTESERFISSETFPISLVRDFDEFLDYIHNRPVLLTKTKEYISRKHLPALNERLSVKNEAATSHTEQDYYPYIHFFYYLAISGGLLEKSPVKAGKLQLMETDRLRLYNELTAVEKYFCLLETFWIDVNWIRPLDIQFYNIALPLQEVFSAISLELLKPTDSRGNNEREAKVISAQIFDNFNYLPLYFEWLGFWKCEADQERINDYFLKNHYFAKSISVTDFGAKMIPILLLERNLNIWNIALRHKEGEINPIPGSKLEDMMLGDIPQEIVEALYERMDEDQSSQPFFQPFVKLFPNGELKRTLPRNLKKFIDGIYTFKVYFSNSIWRKVVLSGKHTMDNLHNMILEAFNFDDDHLYSFFMDGKKWSEDCIVSPYDDYGYQHANKVQIGMLGLRSKQRFLYLYDYGDEWTFVVEVDHLEEIDSVSFKPYVKEGKGEAPEQYDYYDD